MRNKIVSKFIAIAVVALLGVFYGCCTEGVFAVNEGGGYEGGGYQTGVDCDISWSTVYACAYGRGDTGGASWKWHRWEPNADLNGDGKNDAVEIPSYVNENYPEVNLIGENHYISGCGDVGGYWRYAFVAVRDGNEYDNFHYLKYKNGNKKNFKKGEQLGLASIGSQYRSYRAEAFLEGEMYYNSSLSDRSFGIVGNIYNALKNKDPGSFTLGWNGNSSLSWFCAPDPNLSSFEGTSRVLQNNVEWNDNMVNNGTGFQFNPLWKPDSSNKNRYVYDALIIRDCDPIDGCNATFRHYLNKVGGSNGNNASTTYSITRNVDGVSEWVVRDASYNSAGSNNVADNTLRMYPGQRICETLWFNSERDYNEVSTAVCAVAVTTEESDISVQIRDQKSGDEYKNWRDDEVYAKPGDNVELKGTYTPYYQPMYGTVINGPFKVNSFVENGKSSIGQVFDANINPGWKNVFSVEVGGDCGSAISGTIGSSNTYDGVRSYIVQGGDVGEEKIKRGSALTNCNDNVKNTPNSVSLTYSDGNGFDVNVDVSSKLSNDVKIKVPYNFQNSTDIKLDGKTIYAGESTTVSYDVIVGARYNNLTIGNYATPVPNASWGLEMKIGNGDWSPVSDSGGNGNLNSPTENGGIGYLPDGNREQKGRNVSIPVPDVPAGTEVCFRSWVSPSLSGADKNLSESGFDKKPAWDEDCTKIAKRPSFQVWGGGIYSAGNLNLEKTLANKITLSGYPDGIHVFGSWAELSLVAEGKVTGLASGAGLGYGVTIDADSAKKKDEDMSGLGGSNNDNYDNYCSISTLSIANSDCNSAGVGNLGRSSGRSGDKSSLISDFVQEGDQFNIEGGFSLSGVDDNRKTDKGVYYYDGKNKKLSIFESAIGAGATKVVRTNDDVAILGNIVYQNEGYSDLESIPKIIIYAKNINISCSVTRIDAVLIADEKINTCSDNVTDNSSLRSTPLMIRGSVISNTLTLGRTYGAATGKNSVIPAEIINYDTSLYLWANNQSSVTTSGKLTETYINELAPRY